MENNNVKISKIKKTDPFKVPESYFEDFIADMMAHLPDRPVEIPQVISLWERVRPYIYMVAMFIGIWLMINLFTKNSAKRDDIVNIYVSGGLKLNSANDIDDFYRYYEDELTKIVYDDTVADFLENIDADCYLSKK